ncbi:MAG: sterol carrier protein domain-containing protein [Acidimicrobiales bacterium]|nr:sterol carrier protein domain-containing protein [Acidimicrobiales bacterium]
MDRQTIPGSNLVPFDFDRDMESVLRTWSEAGWWDDEDAQKEKISDFFMANDGRTVVGLIDGSAECVVHRTLGTVRYDQQLLSLGCVSAVTTSRIARRRRLASRLTARTVAHLADEGCAVAMLGMFDQGFYDRFGFGTGAYENHAWIYPGALAVPAPYQAPQRFDLDSDSEELHEAMASRLSVHGGVVVGGERLTAAGMRVDDDVSIYGYRTDGQISHFLAVVTTGEHGPDRITQWAYQTPEQCLELLRLVQEWGDQVDVVRLTEPVWLQLQDFIVDPGAQLRRTKGSQTGALRIEADAWWQARIVDLAACVEAMGPVDEPFSVVVRIEDPVEPHLVNSGYDGDWNGLDGTWRLSFGATHTAERISDGEPIDLETTINALTRWWLGVLPASTLVAMGAFECTADTADRMDTLTSHLPKPQPGWDF